MRRRPLGAFAHMPVKGKIVVAAALSLCGLFARGQDLSPRAYVITPVNSNAVNVTYAYNSGGLEFDGGAPITGATAKINLSIVSYYHSLDFFGRSANVSASLPYGLGNFQGTAFGAEQHAYRSGLLDSFYRFSVNLIGGPAMRLPEIRTWQQKRLLGASFKVVAPTGQYDPTKLLNWGNNRWAFKPEIGFSQRWGHWVLDTYAAGWFFTTDEEYFSYNRFFPGHQTQSQSPIAAFEGHLSYDIRPRFWISLDGNYWRGGNISISGIENPRTEQKNSRVGVTASIPLNKRQALKIAYNNGAYISYGGNYQNVSVGWQYSWVGLRPH
jgi:hypothetical protein